MSAVSVCSPSLCMITGKKNRIWNWWDSFSLRDCPYILPFGVSLSSRYASCPAGPPWPGWEHLHGCVGIYPDIRLFMASASGTSLGTGRRDIQRNSLVRDKMVAGDYNADLHCCEQCRHESLFWVNSFFHMSMLFLWVRIKYGKVFGTFLPRSTCHVIQYIIY